MQGVICKIELDMQVEIIEPRDPLAQLEVSKSSIGDLFKDLLNEQNK